MESECGGVQARFGARIDMARQLVNNYIGKTPTKNIGSDLARRIETVFGKPVGWMDDRHDSAAAAASPDVVISRLRAASPLLAALPGALESSVNQLAVSREWMRRNVGGRAAEHMVLVTVTGGDMAPTLQEGALVLVDRSVTAVTDEGIYLLTSADAKRRHDAVFRRINRTLDGRYRIRGDNPIVEAETHASMKAAGVLVLGRVVVAMEVKRL